jgi:hypothetical protein
MKYYAGIGSRETPIELKNNIRLIVEYLNGLDYTLRSGAAPGADSFFEEYANKKEIFLPWRDFNGNDSQLYSPTKESFEMASRYHPGWNRLSFGARKLMARNCHQVLGRDLKTPVKFIVCWTKDGGATGGTGQALRMAADLNIPIYNLFFENILDKIKSDVIF